MSFIFNADGHLVEPNNLFSDGSPPALRQLGLHAEKHDDFIYSTAGAKVLNKTPIHREAVQMAEGESFARPDRRGNREMEFRLKDMALDGVDAEIVFPSLGLSAFLIEIPEAELATAQVCNEWVDALLKELPQNFVRCGILPVRDFTHTVAEMERLASLGFTAAMLPSLIGKESGLPGYDSDKWDKVFDAADGFITIMTMVAGGLLDRFPKSRVCVVEGGASWLAGLAERMDEVYEAHAPFMRPKLSVRPSEVIARQVSCAFQYDRACIMSRSVTSTKALMWAAGYPHHEGTFPRSREVTSPLFDGVDISAQDKADILGLNAARLFRLPHPAVIGQAA